MPVHSVRGPYGGYRLGSGVRPPPVMFSATEALGLVMAVLDGHHDAGDETEPVGAALGKVVRALPGVGGRPGPGHPPHDRPGPGPRRGPARPRDDDRPGPGQLAEPPGPAAVPVGGGQGVGDRGGPVGGRRPPRPVVPAAAGPGPSGPSAHTGSTGCATSSRWTSRSSGPADLDPVAMLEQHLAVGWEFAGRGRRRVVPRQGRALPLPRPRPARGGRRRAHEADRLDGEPVLVRRAARGHPGPVPRRRWGGAPAHRRRPGPAAARRQPELDSGLG